MFIASELKKFKKAVVETQSKAEGWCALSPG